MNVIAHNYAFIDFKQWLTLISADENRWLYSLSKKNWTKSEFPLIGNFCAQISKTTEQRQSHKWCNFRVTHQRFSSHDVSYDKIARQKSPVYGRLKVQIWTCPSTTGPIIVFATTSHHVTEGHFRAPDSTQLISPGSWVELSAYSKRAGRSLWTHQKLLKTGCDPVCSYWPIAACIDWKFPA